MVSVHKNSLPVWQPTKIAPLEIQHFPFLGPLWRKWMLYSTLNVHVIQHWSMFVRLMHKNASLC